MEYRFIKPSREKQKTKSGSTLYIIPLSADPAEYGIIHPEGMQNRLLTPEYIKNLEIRHYRGCPGDILEQVKHNLSIWLKEETEKKIRVAANTRFLGLVLVFAGIVNFFFPDPLILLDELLILGGGIILLSQWAAAKKTLPHLAALRNEGDILLKNIHPREDALCTALFNAIKSRAVCGEENDNSWLEAYLEVEDIIGADPTRRQDLQHIYTGVESLLPLKQYGKIEQKISNKLRKQRPVHKLVQKRKKIFSRLAAEGGFTEDALVVYRAIPDSLSRLFPE